MRTLKTALVMVLFLNMSIFGMEEIKTYMYYEQSEIISAYKMANIPADARFKYRVITVKGTVKSIRHSRNENAIYLSDGENNVYIRCCFDESEEMKRQEGVFCGDEIIITGECKGKKRDIIINDCVINKVIYNPVWCLGLF